MDIIIIILHPRNMSTVHLLAVALSAQFFMVRNVAATGNGVNDRTMIARQSC